MGDGATMQKNKELLMLKVVIFDSGWGGEMFADYVEEQIKVIDVIRVIDWRNAPYNKHTKEEIIRLSEAALYPYIGNVNVIVLASNEVTAVALDYLKKKYPEQKFVGFNWDELRKWSTRRILVLTTGLVKQSNDYLKAKKNWVKAKIKECLCEDWAQLIDDGELTNEKIEADIGNNKAYDPDVIMLGCTQFADIKNTLSKIFGWRTTIIDNYRPTLQELCHALGFLGGDGERRR